MKDEFSDIYHIIGSILIKYEKQEYDYICYFTYIMGSDLSSMTLLSSANNIVSYKSVKLIDIKALMKLSVVLRDKMLELTGDKIWGLTFTLYPNGKFEIEYDYDKPEDYEESDEVITGKEINQIFLK